MIPPSLNQRLKQNNRKQNHRDPKVYNQKSLNKKKSQNPIRKTDKMRIYSPYRKNGDLNS